MSGEAETVLIDQIDRSIERIEMTPGTCPAHDALAFGLITLLRCQRATMRNSQLVMRWATIAGLGAGGVVAAGIETAKKFF